MKFPKVYLAAGVVVIIVIAVATFFVVYAPTAVPVKQSAAVSAPVSTSANVENNKKDNVAEVPVAKVPADGKMVVTPIDTKVGSVSGVDLSGLASDANQSAALSAQDGVSDLKNISTYGQEINSSTDSINNPIQ